MIDLKIKRSFFDRERVIAAIGRAKIGWLRKSALTVRKVARNSMKAGFVHKKGTPRGHKNRRIAPAGSPPYYVTKLLKDYLFASFDMKRGIADIGPVKVSTANQAGGIVPRRLEKGGSGIITDRSPSGKVEKVRATWKPHPYMYPALAKVRPTLPKSWAGAVHT